MHHVFDPNISIDKNLNNTLSIKLHRFVLSKNKKFSYTYKMDFRFRIGLNFFIVNSIAFSND